MGKIVPIIIKVRLRFAVRDAAGLKDLGMEAVSETIRIRVWCQNDSILVEVIEWVK
jgi:hypothetical protein